MIVSTIFSVCDVCDSCLLCNAWLKKQVASTPLTSSHGSGAIALKPVDANVSNSLAAFQQLHNRLVSVEEAVHGSTDGGVSIVVTSLNLIELVTSSGGATRPIWRVGKDAATFPFFGGEYVGYEDWEYRVGIFLNSECPLFALFFTCLES